MTHRSNSIRFVSGLRCTVVFMHLRIRFTSSQNKKRTIYFHFALSLALPELEDPPNQNSLKLSLQTLAIEDVSCFQISFSPSVPAGLSSMKSWGSSMNATDQFIPLVGNLRYLPVMVINQHFRFLPVSLQCQLPINR